MFFFFYFSMSRKRYHDVFTMLNFCILTFFYYGWILFFLWDFKFFWNQTNFQESIVTDQQCLIPLVGEEMGFYGNCQIGDTFKVGLIFKVPTVGV